MSNPAKVKIIGKKVLNGDSDGYSVWDSEEYAAVANGPGDYGFTIIDIKNKTNPKVYSYLYAAGSLEEVYARRDGSIVYAALKYYGLVIYDTSNLASPSIIT